MYFRYIHWQSVCPKDGRTVKLPLFTRWCHEALHAALSTILMAGWQLNFPSGCHWGEVRGKVGAHVPKTQGLKCHGQGQQLCNTEGTRGVGQTDRQTDYLGVIVRCPRLLLLCACI